jgi:hypothetical protein
MSICPKQRINIVVNDWFWEQQIAIYIEQTESKQKMVLSRTKFLQAVCSSILLDPIADQLHEMQ